MIYCPRSIGLFANGVFAGLGLCMNFVNVPAIRATNDPLPVFYKTYNNGSRIAIISILVSTVANGICYYKTDDRRFAYASFLSLFSAPFTMIAIAPINNRLFALKNSTNVDRGEVNTLINQWNKRQWFRTVAGIAAFVINISYK